MFNDTKQYQVMSKPKIESTAFPIDTVTSGPMLQWPPNIILHDVVNLVLDAAKTNKRPHCAAGCLTRPFHFLGFATTISVIR